MKHTDLKHVDANHDLLYKAIASLIPSKREIPSTHLFALLWLCWLGILKRIFLKVSNSIIYGVNFDGLF